MVFLSLLGLGHLAYHPLSKVVVNDRTSVVFLAGGCFMFVWFLRLNSFLYHILKSIYLLMVTWLFSYLSTVNSVTMNKGAGLPSLHHMDFLSINQWDCHFPPSLS